MRKKRTNKRRNQIRKLKTQTRASRETREKNEPIKTIPERRRRVKKADEGGIQKREKQ